MDKDFSNRIMELAIRAEKRGAYTYSGFLSPTKLNDALSLRLPVKAESFGGAEFVERKMVRFGDFGYEEDYPISIIKVDPVNAKFSTPVKHRDYLGALLNLGIDRERVGDILVKDDVAFIPVTENLTTFICENLKKVAHNTVKCEVAKSIPEDFKPVTESVIVPVSSIRLDAILCKTYNLSREDGVELFKQGRVSVNGRQIETPSFEPKEGDVITTRGFGKAVYCGEVGVSSKGKRRIGLEKYV